MKKEYRSVIRTKKKIRTAFIELLGEKKNIGSITVSELAERADIAKSTFYNHYEDIYSVVEEFKDELIEEISGIFAEIEQDRGTEYEEYLRRITGFMKANEDFYRVIVSSSDAHFYIETMKNLLAKKFFETTTELSFLQDKNERYVQIRFLTNAYVDTMTDYFGGLLKISLDEVCEVIISMIKKNFGT